MENIIQQLIADFQEFKTPDLIERDISIPNVKGCANTIIGMRRVGKTYLLFQEMQKLLHQGVKQAQLLYLNFEDERLADVKLEHMQLITDIYFRLFPENRNCQVYFFFDEIQNVANWEKYCRRLLDTEQIRLYLTGSSSTMLSRDIASSMRGRSFSTEVYPFSFVEFLRFREITPPDNLNLVSSKLKSQIEHAFQEYLQQGGFPATLAQEDFVRTQMLQGYVDSVIFRDIVERHGITQISILRYLLRRILLNTASKFSINKFFNEIKSQGMKCGKNTLHEYLEYLQDAFLVFSVYMKTDSDKQRLVNPRKVYAIDPGLISVFLPANKIDQGHLLENMVFLELRRRQAVIEYVTTKSTYEVDFHVTFHNKSTELIQVCAEISDKNTREREIRAIVDTPTRNQKEKIIISMNHEEQTNEAGNKINIIPAWKWLLQKN